MPNEYVYHYAFWRGTDDEGEKLGEGEIDFFGVPPSNLTFAYGYMYPIKETQRAWDFVERSKKLIINAMAILGIPILMREIDDVRPDYERHLMRSKFRTSV